jgi:maltooligosyltrehalose trehalohydrolase
MHGTTNPITPAWRRLPVGVEIDAKGQAHARVWAPRRKSVELVCIRPDGGIGDTATLTREPSGYFSGFIAGLQVGSRYKFRLDGGDAFADPASRYQPQGPHGPSQVVDPSSFTWTDDAWRGLAIDGQVISEIHIGTFSETGTFRGAIEKLDAIADVGITALEIMPVADFGGEFGWGYDGVNLYAPTRLYGTPDDFRALVNASHERGIGIILDVVYNHLGPDGNYLTQFSESYLGSKPTEWGDAINFDGENSAPVREFIIENAAYWITEFHVDGLRLDATQQIFDQSPNYIVADIVTRARAAAGDRSIVIVGENEPQQVRFVKPQGDGGYGLDALWNDDFHHAAFVAASGKAEAYYSGYTGRAQEFVSAAKYGFLYQGQYYAWQKNRRGTSALHVDPKRFVNYLESHDQVSNLARSRRMHQLTDPARLRALTALLLLLPQTPMLFQGQEFCASAAFPYFAGHKGDLARQVREGRAKFVSQFPSAAAAGAFDILPDPADPRTVEMSRIDWSERQTHSGALRLHRDLIALRKSDPVISAQRGANRGGLDGIVITDHAFALRYFAADDLDRLLVVNLGARKLMDPLAEPLTAPPTNCRWRTLWASEDPRYGGSGAPDVDVEGKGWIIPAHAAVLLHAEPLDDTQASR